MLNRRAKSSTSIRGTDHQRFFHPVPPKKIWKLSNKSCNPAIIRQSYWPCENIPNLALYRKMTDRFKCTIPTMLRFEASIWGTFWEETSDESLHTPWTQTLGKHLGQVRDVEVGSDPGREWSHYATRPLMQWPKTYKGFAPTSVLPWSVCITHLARRREFKKSVTRSDSLVTRQTT